MSIPQFKSKAEYLAYMAAKKQQQSVPQQPRSQQQQPPQQQPLQRQQPQQRSTPAPAPVSAGRSLEADVSFVAGAATWMLATTTCRVPVYRKIPTGVATSWPAPAAWIDEGSTLLVHGPQQYTSDKHNIWMFVRHVNADSGAVTTLALPLVLGDPACQNVAGLTSDEQTLTSFHLPCTTNYDLNP